MRVLVTGATGQVGSDLSLVLSGLIPPAGSHTALLGGEAVEPGEFEVTALSRGDLDICDRGAVRSVLERTKPDTIINLAAYTKVDAAEDEVEAAYATNDGGVENLAAAAEAVTSRLIHLSTDYVFAGNLGRALTEDDSVDPQSVYGASKLAGERHVREGCVVRSSWIVGVAGRTVIDIAIAAADEGRRLRFVDDQVGTLTSSADLAAGLVTVLREPLDGVLHLAGTGSASWYEIIATAVSLAGGSRDQVEAIATSDLHPAQRATRPAYAPLVSNRLGGRSLPAWQEGLERLIKARRAG